MKDSFFVRSKKRRDEEFSDESDIENMDLEHKYLSSESSDEETAQEKRIRLAKSYINSLAPNTEQQDFDAKEIDNEIIASRLKKDALFVSGKAKRKLLNKNPSFSKQFIPVYSTSVTCLAIDPLDRFIYAACKNGTIVKYSFNGEILHVFLMGKRKEKGSYKGHTDIVFTLSISHDGKYLASGGKDKTICIWSVEKDELLHTFKHHRDCVNSLAFRRDSNTLFSASSDRTIKLFNIDELAYIETLFGHQDCVVSVDSIGSEERCVSTGSRDRTVRVWKIVEESQLLYRFSSKNVSDDDAFGLDNSGSLDVVTAVDDETWITGTDGGVLSLWNLQKKKPLYSLPNAHGRIFLIDSEYGGSEDVSLDRNAESAPSDCLSNPHWIISISGLPFSDIFASGSSDGKVRLWNIDSNHSKFSQFNEIDIDGYVNSLKFSQSGKYLIIGTGLEHVQGRWKKIDCSSGITIVELDGLLSQ